MNIWLIVGIVVVVIVIALVWYFWSKNQPSDVAQQAANQPVPATAQTLDTNTGAQVIPPAANPANTLIITNATYGVPGTMWNVTSTVNTFVNNNQLSLPAMETSEDIVNYLGVPADYLTGQVKQLVIDYTLGGQKLVDIVPDGTPTSINVATS